MKFFARGADRGDIMVLTLVFVVMFLTIFMALSGFTGSQHRQTVLQAQDELAFQVAEAGLNYARWRLAHNPEDFSVATKDVTDQFAGTIGSYEVTFEEPQAGSTVVVLTSTGTTASQPSREMTLTARYGIPSLARYASITNNDVWYGGEIHGYTHSNGGIRMDGESDSLMTSAKETYTCTPTHGCNNQTRPGVWGDGEIQELWEFPVPAVDYNALTLDLLEMKTAAQDAGTYYGPSNNYGYQIVFTSNDRYSIYRVTSLSNYIESYFPETGTQYTSHDIGNRQLIHTKDVPDDGVIFVEDRLWVQGDIRSRITVGAAKFPDNPSTRVDIILNGNISYGGVKDGTRSFGAVAQNHVLIPYAAAQNVMQLDGAYVAQQGRFGRRYYAYGSHRLKTSLTRYGMIASNLTPVTAWLNNGVVVSGFQSGSATYDPNFLYGPPPYFPTSGQYEFISWEEEE